MHAFIFLFKMESQAQKGIRAYLVLQEVLVQRARPVLRVLPVQLGHRDQKGKKGQRD